MRHSTLRLLLLASAQLALTAHFSIATAIAAQGPAAKSPAQTATKTPAQPAAATPAATTPSAAAPSATSPATTTSPATETAPATATIPAVPAITPDPAVNAASTTPDKPKKIWTNEEVTGISSTISVVGDTRNAKSKASPQTPAAPSYIASVRKQLEKLKAQMADADKELATLKDFSEGEPVATADREFHKNYNNQPIAQQMSNLQSKKKDLQSKIDALLDEARKKGIEPGQLR